MTQGRVESATVEEAVDVLDQRATCGFLGLEPVPFQKFGLDLRERRFRHHFISGLTPGGKQDLLNQAGSSD